MLALCAEAGVARIIETAAPEPGPGELRIRVAASGIHHADRLQIGGRYPVPEGESAVPGLECAGWVDALGPSCGDRYRPGQAVMALLGGGGHAELVVVPAAQVLPVPTGWTWEEAGAFPEAALTAWTALVTEGHLQPGAAVLVAGVTGGVGEVTARMASLLGAGRVAGSSRDAGRLRALAAAGVEFDAIQEPPPPGPLVLPPGAFDLIVDLVGGPGAAARIAALAEGGRWVLLGLLAGRTAELDLTGVLRRRLCLCGSLLRPRSRAEKGALVAAVERRLGSALAAGLLRPRLVGVHPAAEAVAACAAFGGDAAPGRRVLRWPAAELREP